MACGLAPLGKGSYTLKLIKVGPIPRGNSNSFNAHSPQWRLQSGRLTAVVFRRWATLCHRKQGCGGGDCRVSLRPVLNLPNYVSGLFNYRGVVVPVIDLSFLIQNRPSGQNLSSRIIMVTSSHNNGKDQYIGLLSEGVTDTISHPLNAFHETGLKSSGKPYLGGIALDKRGMVQILHLNVLLEQIRPSRQSFSLD
jgi:chemotaxis-related protein WspB